MNNEYTICIYLYTYLYKIVSVIYGNYNMVYYFGTYFMYNLCGRDRYFLMLSSNIQSCIWLLRIPNNVPLFWQKPLCSEFFISYLSVEIKSLFELSHGRRTMMHSFFVPLGLIKSHYSAVHCSGCPSVRVEICFTRFYYEFLWSLN